MHFSRLEGEAADAVSAQCNTHRAARLDKKLQTEEDVAITNFGQGCDRIAQQLGGLVFMSTACVGPVAIDIKVSADTLA